MNIQHPKPTLKAAVCDLSLPVIARGEITTDEAGSFNLNTLHRANGGENKNGPSYWFALAATKELIAELGKKLGDTEITVSDSRRGVIQSTFALALLVNAHAGWITFQLRVNKEFLDYRTGQIPAQVVSPALTTMEILQLVMKSEQELLRLAVATRELEQQFVTDAPLVRFAKKVEVAPSAFSMAQSAKILGSGQMLLFAYLRQIGWVTSFEEPYQTEIELGLLDILGTPHAGIAAVGHCVPDWQVADQAATAWVARELLL